MYIFYEFLVILSSKLAFELFLAVSTPLFCIMFTLLNPVIFSCLNTMKPNPSCFPLNSESKRNSAEKKQFIEGAKTEQIV